MKDETFVPFDRFPHDVASFRGYRRDSILLYAIVLIRVNVRAQQHLIDPQLNYAPRMIYRPELFRPEGEPFRIRAIRISWIGLVLLMLVIFLV